MRFITALIFVGILGSQTIHGTAPHALNILDSESGEQVHSLSLPFPYLECDEHFRHNHAWVFQGGYVVSQQSTEPRYFLLGPLCPCVGLIVRGKTPMGPKLFVGHLDFLTDLTQLPDHFLEWEKESLDITLHSMFLSEEEGYSSKRWGDSSFSMRQAHFGRSQQDHLDFIRAILRESLDLKPHQITVSLHTADEALTDDSDLYLVDQYYAVDGMGKIWCIPPIRAQFPYLVPHTCADGEAVIQRLMDLINAKGLALRTSFGLDRMPHAGDWQKYPLLKLFEI